jgi:hypothetical protein
MRIWQVILVLLLSFMLASCLEAYGSGDGKDEGKVKTRQEQQQQKPCRT